MHNLSTTQTELILVAEQMFGECGIEGASLRVIAARAGQGNTNAVKYHFGSRQGLIEALFNYRIVQMEEPRRRLLEEVKRQDRLGDARALIETLCLPYLDLRDANGRHSYANFLLQYQRVHLTSGSFLRLTDQAPVHGELLGHFDARIAFVPEPLRYGRMMQVVVMFASFLVRMDRSGLRDPTSPDFFLSMNDTLETMAAAYSAPYRAPYGAGRYASEGLAAPRQQTPRPLQTRTAMTTARRRTAPRSVG